MLHTAKGWKYYQLARGTMAITSLAKNTAKVVTYGLRIAYTLGISCTT